VQNPIAVPEVTITSSLEGLQTEEQSHVLDIITQLRKCGLDSVLQLPQIVVCGDQSAGKSSVLEALTEIPFPRSDNLCTRYATEIILRRAVTNSLTIKVIPDDDRSTAEKESISSFKAVITNFDDLPETMEKAMSVMGIESDLSSDVLSVEIEGPTRPQLTLVDLPGLIQTDTRGVTKADVQLVAEITDRYIGQSRTICLAVIAATNDYANQGILTKVRNVDPKGERTLGIITKPDRLSPGSGLEKAYFDLARNEDVHFTLGWHVLKNRAFEESSNSFMERNASEAAYFRKSIFKVLPKQDVGIDSLRDRLSKLLFHHVQQELPRLQEDLQEALTEAKTQLKILGVSRSTPQECKEYLTQLSLDFYEICKAAASGHYEGDYFTSDVDKAFSVNSPASRRRLRAVIQFMNNEFSENFRKTGHKYHIDMPVVFQGALPNGGPLEETGFVAEEDDNASPRKTAPPINKTASEALEWVSQVLIRTRGKELAGNFNPLLIGELFWEQSSKWPSMAMDYVDKIEAVCTQFLKDLLLKKCPKDIHPRLWSSVLQDSVKKRYEAAIHELELLQEDLESFPINYNHYYIDNIAKAKMKRYEASPSKSMEGATQHNPVPGFNPQSHTSGSIDIVAFINRLFRSTNPNMNKHSCEDALDCMFSIYKVCPQNTP
jgi:GTPase SAR1 family protein